MKTKRGIAKVILATSAVVILSGACTFLVSTTAFASQTSDASTRSQIAHFLTDESPVVDPVPNPDPTIDPVPTDTPEPTVTPDPTEPPSPTETPEPVPTDTPEPVPTDVPVVPPVEVPTEAPVPSDVATDPDYESPGPDEDTPSETPTPTPTPVPVPTSTATAPPPAVIELPFYPPPSAGVVRDAFPFVLAGIIGALVLILGFGTYVFSRWRLRRLRFAPRFAGGRGGDASRHTVPGTSGGPVSDSFSLSFAPVEQPAGSSADDYQLGFAPIVANSAAADGATESVMPIAVTTGAPSEPAASGRHSDRQRGANSDRAYGLPATWKRQGTSAGAALMSFVITLGGRRQSTASSAPVDASLAFAPRDAETAVSREFTVPFFSARAAAPSGSPDFDLGLPAL